MGKVSNTSRRKAILIGLVFAQAVDLFAQVGYFNHGRTRNVAGMAFSKDGKSLYHTIMVKPEGTKSYFTKIAVSQWQNEGWSEPRCLNLTSGNESYPVLSQDDKHLYFTSTTSMDSNRFDINIWETQHIDNSWAKPKPIDELNTTSNERIVHVDSQNTFYVSSDKSGDFDIYITRRKAGIWERIEKVDAWNSPEHENYVSVYPEFGLAFIQRFTKKETIELLYSQFQNNSWTVAKPLKCDYDYNNHHLNYALRTPMLSPDGGTFYLTVSRRIWQQATVDLLGSNGIAAKHIPPKLKTLPVRPLQSAEPEIFGGLTLKTNNGISFSKDGNTIYLSQYSQDKTDKNERLIKVYQAKKNGNLWSKPSKVQLRTDPTHEYHPVVSEDGKRLFFNSNFPDKNEKNDIWYADLSHANSPKKIDVLASNEYDDYVSEALSGTLYFRSDRAGGKGSGDIYMAKKQGNNYQNPLNIEGVNGAENENDVCVSADESILIFNRYIEKDNEMQLYVSIKRGKNWSEPRMINQLERKEEWELTPVISRDLNYLFYEVDSNILRIPIEQILTEEELRIIKRKN